MCSMHPNIVQLREVFLTEHHLAVAMEYADGGDLSEYIDQQYQRGVRASPLRPSPMRLPPAARRLPLAEADYASLGRVWRVSTSCWWVVSSARRQMGSQFQLP